MLITIIFLVSFISIFILLIKMEDGILFPLIISIVSAIFLVSIITPLIDEIIYKNNKDVSIYINTKRIYSLNFDTNNMNIKGSFTLGTGNLNSIEYYFVIVNTKFGYKIEKFPIKNSYIQYTDKKPFVKIIKHESKYGYYKDYKYIFYIPKGSILINYKIKL